MSLDISIPHNVCETTHKFTLPCPHRDLTVKITVTTEQNVESGIRSMDYSRRGLDGDLLLAIRNVSLYYKYQ